MPRRSSPLPDKSVSPPPVSAAPLHSAAPRSSPTLVWLDMEMTGLDPTINTVIEAAVLITDGSLQTIAEGPDLIIQHDPRIFTSMDQWNQNQHTKSGLWHQAINSTLDLKSAEDQLLKFVMEHVKPREGILAGNSIWQDRRFIINYFPRLHAYLHYRMLDVTSYKIMFSQWFKPSYTKAKEAHRARSDIEESIAELKFYRDLVVGKE